MHVANNASILNTFDGSFIGTYKIATPSFLHKKALGIFCGGKNIRPGIGCFYLDTDILIPFIFIEFEESTNSNFLI